jgi:hypothetical protein
MILDDRTEADEIASELNGRGHEVNVIELLGPQIPVSVAEEPAG